MDTSKGRILMCEKAVEIQKQWKIKQGDFSYINRKPLPSYISIAEHDDVAYWKKFYKISIWLPRQDQLQDMVDGSLFGKLSRFTKFAYRCAEFNDCLIECDMKSMEQLWLAFVMKEKYDKVWDGKNWVKSE